MAQIKQPRLTREEKLSLAQAAAQTERLAVLGEVIDANLATKPTEHWRKLTEEHKEVVLYRIAAGDTVSHVCRELGISPGLIYMAQHMDEEFGARYERARSVGALALVDRMRDIARDETLTDARALLEFKILSWIAARHNRKAYGEKIEVTGQVATTVNMPDWMFGHVVEGQLTDHSDPHSDNDPTT